MPQHEPEVMRDSERMEALIATLAGDNDPTEARLIVGSGLRVADATIDYLADRIRAEVPPQLAGATLIMTYRLLHANLGRALRDIERGHHG